MVAGESILWGEKLYRHWNADLSPEREQRWQPTGSCLLRGPKSRPSGSDTGSPAHGYGWFLLFKPTAGSEHLFQNLSTTTASFCQCRSRCGLKHVSLVSKPPELTLPRIQSLTSVASLTSPPPRSRRSLHRPLNMAGYPPAQGI